MGKRLYVGNLSYNVTSQKLEEMFTEFGAVRSAEVVQDRDTGRRSKGFGFVEMTDENGAREAITNMHEKECDGRRLTVNEARPRDDRGGGGGVVAVAVDTAAAAVVVAAVAIDDSRRPLQRSLR